MQFESNQQEKGMRLSLLISRSLWGSEWNYGRTNRQNRPNVSWLANYGWTDCFGWLIRDPNLGWIHRNLNWSKWQPPTKQHQYIPCMFHTHVPKQIPRNPLQTHWICKAKTTLSSGLYRYIIKVKVIVSRNKVTV